jgi:hypothetical protein
MTMMNDYIPAFTAGIFKREGKAMSYIEGRFLQEEDGVYVLVVDELGTFPLADGKAVKFEENGEWVSGIHIGGEVIYSRGKKDLQAGERIRIRK